MRKYLDEYLNKNYSDIKHSLKEDDIKAIMNTFDYTFYALRKCISNFKEELFKGIKKIKQYIKCRNCEGEEKV